MDKKKQIFEICLQQLKNRGSVLLLPTETVYGLMCDWNDSIARERIIKMKSCKSGKLLQMLAPNIEAVIDYGIEITPDIKKVVDKCCPGPITIIANIKEKKNFRENTVGFRIPAYPFLLDLMKESDRLFAATSANLAGELPATTIADALEFLKDQPDVAVDAGKIQGDASTVVDMTGEKFKILRQGVVIEKELRNLLCLQV